MEQVRFAHDWGGPGLAFSAYAQTSRGTVTGTLLDASRALIGGGRVTLTGVGTGVKLSTQSNDTGVYRFDAVDLGAYELQVAHPVFRTYRGTGITAGGTFPQPRFQR